MLKMRIEMKNNARDYRKTESIRINGVHNRNVKLKFPYEF